MSYTMDNQELTLWAKKLINLDVGEGRAVQQTAGTQKIFAFVAAGMDQIVHDDDDHTTSTEKNCTAA